MLEKNKNIVFVEKTWGWEQWHANSPLYCSKLLFIKKANSTSNHRHLIKAETLINSLHSAPLLVKYCEDEEYKDVKEIILYPGDSLFMPNKTWHKLIAVYGDVYLQEASTEHKNEDVERIKE